MSLPNDVLQELYLAEREQSKALKEKNNQLSNEVERLRKELGSAKNDNELKRSAGEGMQSSEYDEESKREPLGAANASIKEIQHSRKELDQELRTQRRHNVVLQASLEQAQDAKAELQHSLKRMQDARDETDRSRASDYAERSHEVGERLQKKEQSLQAQEVLLRDQKPKFPVPRLAFVKPRIGPASKQIAPMPALRAGTHTGLQNQGSRSEAVGRIKTEPQVQPNFEPNPGAIAFRPTDVKSMAQAAVEPRPPVVSQPEEEDDTREWMRSVVAKWKAKAAKADAVAKSEIPDNKKVKDAAAGKKDTPSHDAITGKRKFEEDDMSRAQQSGPKRA